MNLEIELCQSIDSGFASRNDPPRYHVEVRIIPVKGAHSIVFRSETTLDKEKAKAVLKLAREAFQK